MNPLVSRHQFCVHLEIAYCFDLIILNFYQILDKIFEQLSIPDLKSCRLVCQTWEDYGTTLFGTRTYLNVNQLFDYDDESNLYLAFPLVNQKLIRSLKMYDEFKSIAKKYEGIDVITKGLSMLKSNNIRHVFLLVWESTNRADQRIPPKLAVHHNLTTITYRAHPRSGYTRLHPVLQALIDSAPNLTLLDIWASSFPDLERCRKLKSLKFYFIHADHSVTINNVTAMLDKAKDSLTEVEFSYKNHLRHGLQVNIELYIRSFWKLSKKCSYVYVR